MGNKNEIILGKLSIQHFEKSLMTYRRWRSTIFDTIPFESKVQGSSNLTAGKGEIEKAKFSDIAVDRAFESTRVPPINPCS